MNHPSDASVVQRVVAGDVEAFALLVDRHHGRMARYAYHLLGSEAEAEEAVQDAFVRAYRSLGTYREREQFGAWIMRIVVNRCRTRLAPLARLPAEQREAVVLRYADELGYDEIAAITGAGVSALKMRVKRGCERLRAILEASRAGS